MTQETQDPREVERQKLRGKLMKLKANASTTPLQAWLDDALGIIEEVCVRREQQVKEMHFCGGKMVERRTA